MAPLAGLLLSLFVGVVPASGLDCLRPEDTVARAMKSPSRTFFTGTARTIEPVLWDSMSVVKFDVEVLWHVGPIVPEYRFVEKGDEAQVNATLVVPYETLGPGNGDVVTGRRYHVVLENKSANSCSVFDAEDFPRLTDGIKPDDAFGDLAHLADTPSTAPVEDEAGKARWGVASVGAAVLLGAATLVAFVVARRRRGTRHPGLGALIGLDVGAALAWWLILLPRLRDGDFYEITDPLIVMGLPLLIVGTGIGTIVGSLIGRGSTDSDPRRSGRAVAVVVASVVACLLATWFWLWGTGATRFPS